MDQNTESTITNVNEHVQSKRLETQWGESDQRVQKQIISQRPIDTPSITVDQFVNANLGKAPENLSSTVVGNLEETNFLEQFISSFDIGTMYSSVPAISYHSNHGIQLQQTGVSPTIYQLQQQVQPLQPPPYHIENSISLSADSVGGIIEPISLDSPQIVKTARRMERHFDDQCPDDASTQLLLSASSVCPTGVPFSIPQQVPTPSLEYQPFGKYSMLEPRATNINTEPMTVTTEISDQFPNIQPWWL